MYTKINELSDLYYKIVIQGIELGISSESVLEEAVELYKSNIVSEREFKKFIRFVKSIDESETVNRILGFNINPLIENSYKAKNISKKIQNKYSKGAILDSLFE